MPAVAPYSTSSWLVERDGDSTIALFPLSSSTASFSFLAVPAGIDADVEVVTIADRRRGDRISQDKDGSRILHGRMITPAQILKESEEAVRIATS